MENMKIEVIVEEVVKHQVQLTPKQLGYAIQHLVHKSCGVEDTAGCDLLTDQFGNTYIGGSDWQISSQPNIAKLADAANILITGKVLKAEDYEQQ